MNALHTMLDAFFRYYNVITKYRNYGKKNRATMDGTF